MIDRRFELGTAQISLLGISTITALPRWTTDEFVQQLNNVGYECAEWHPTQNMRSSRQMRQGKVDTSFKRFVKSGHQAYRGEKSLVEVMRAVKETPERGFLLMGSFFFVKYRPDSLNDLEYLQDIIGHKLPMVLYPPTSKNDISGTNRPFGEKLFQPTQEVMDLWGVRTIQELIERYPQEGYSGFCFDNTHSQILGGVDLSHDEGSLRLVLEHTKEVHIRPGAIDMRSVYKKKDPLEDLRQLLSGDEDAWYPRFITCIGQNWRGGRVITEVQTSAFEALHGGKMSVDEVMGYHKRLVDNLGSSLTHTEV